MAEHAIEPIEPYRGKIGEVLAEAAGLMGTQSGSRDSHASIDTWRAMISDGTGFVLLEGSDCTGLLLYSAEYELRFSSMLSGRSARKLPQSATISVCHVLERVRDDRASKERRLLRAAVSHLRSTRSIETIAVQVSPLYEMDLEEALARMGFMSCRRVRMERPLVGRIPRRSTPVGCRVEAPARQDADDLRSIIYHGYFSEIDGYLFPDIAAVCSDPTLFDEFLNSRSIDRKCSVVARMQGHPCGCILVLSGEDRRTGLIGVVAVVPAMRRRGTARAMLSHVMRQLKDHDHNRVGLAVTLENKPAFSLYTSVGFEEVTPRTSISVWRRSVSRPLVSFVP